LETGTAQERNGKSANTAFAQIHHAYERADAPLLAYRHGTLVQGCYAPQRRCSLLFLVAVPMLHELNQKRNPTKVSNLEPVNLMARGVLDPF
jgi:hypothetical protein